MKKRLASLVLLGAGGPPFPSIHPGLLASMISAGSCAIMRSDQTSQMQIGSSGVLPHRLPSGPLQLTYAAKAGGLAGSECGSGIVFGRYSTQ